MENTTPTAFDELFTGLEIKIPLLNGVLQRYINFDNAASTPTFKHVLQKINEFLPYYSSVHRGTGFKSQLSTYLYENAREITLDFFNASTEEFVCIFGKNTTEAINTLANCFPFTSKRNIVITSGMEHHSNDLPWRSVANTIHIKLTKNGQLDTNDFKNKVEKYRDNLALVAINGASNVTGYINRIHELAEITHRAGAQILVDCAQLAPHRSVEMLTLDDPAHLDYLAISAHKMYAPFGTGALIGRKDTLEKGFTFMQGGGTIEIVTLNDVTLTHPPEKLEAGSPNTVGAVALAAAIEQLQVIGMDKVAEHEAELTSYALEKLNQLAYVRVYGDSSPQTASSRLGVIPFEVEKVSHFKLAAILGYEYGIGVRSGCFCAHPYILHLLGISEQESETVRSKILRGDKSHMPGLTRISFGLYNSKGEIDRLIQALEDIHNHHYIGDYVQDKSSGEFAPQGWTPDFRDTVSLAVN